jgi:hypothetical protein
MEGAASAGAAMAGAARVRTGGMLEVLKWSTCASILKKYKKEKLQKN